MSSRKFLTFWLLLLAGVAALGAQDLFFTGSAGSYTTMLLAEEYEYPFIRNAFDLNMEHSGDNIAFKVNPYIYLYPRQDYGEELEMGLRELYLDIYFDSLDLRIGKQQIIWGKADGVFITDIVSPKDLRQFLLPDFDEIRIGVTALKADLYFGDNTLEAVLVPLFTPTRTPEGGSIWSVTPDFPVTPVINSAVEVDMKVANSEIFAKYSHLGSQFDLELMAGYMWDDEPALHIINPGPLEITPEYHRLILGGGSFSTTLAGAVLRGEGAYYSGKYFRTSDIAAGGVIEKDYVNYLGGIDFTLMGINLSAQFIQQAIPEYDKEIIDDQFENMMTFLISDTFFRDTLRLELFSYLGLNNMDSLIRPRIIYDIRDGLELQIGANIFTGDEGDFGQYDDNDMLTVKLEYTF
jgi:hypothetical protein